MPEEKEGVDFRQSFLSNSQPGRKFLFPKLVYFRFIARKEEVMEQNQVSTQPSNVGLNAVVSVGEWILTLLIASIPLVNIIMLFVWGFGSNTKLSKANWAKATLIWMVILVAFYFIVIVSIIGGLGVLSHRFGRY